MALDRDAERALEMVRLAGGGPYETLTAPETRPLFRAGREVLTPDPLPVAEIRELAAPREDGGANPIRLYRSATPVSGGVLPALVYFHGGGWVIGDLDTHDSLRRHLANAANASSSLRITASLRSINFRRRSRTASLRPLGWPNRRQQEASTRSGNVGLSRTDLVRLVVYRGMDCSVIPDITAIHTGRVEGKRQSSGAVDPDEPARPANCS